MRSSVIGRELFSQKDSDVVAVIRGEHCVLLVENEEMGMIPIVQELNGLSL